MAGGVRPLRLCAFLAAMLGTILFLVPAQFGGATSYVIVAGTSMEPTLSDGDLVLVREADQHKIGDVVAFDSGRGMVIHRIVGESAEGFVMQGDNKVSPDEWTPSQKEIIGHRWIRVPEAGHWLYSLKERPQLFGAVVGGLGSLGILGSRRRRRRHGAHAADGINRRRKRPVPTMSLRGAAPLLATLGILCVLSGGLLVFFMLRPAERAETVDVERFQHQGLFSYAASMSPSIIYGTPTIEPSANGSPTPPIYTRLLETLTIGFAYDFVAPHTSDMAGSVSADLRIRAGEDGWVRELPLLAAQEFEGETAAASFDVEWPDVAGLIETAEEQAGLAPAQYDLAVVTEVTLTGEANGPVEDVFVAELPMDLTSTELAIDEEMLSITESVTEPQQTRVSNDLEVFGISVPVSPARVLTGAAFATLLLGGGAYALLVQRRVGSGEIAKIRLLYGSLIVPTANGPEGGRCIEVASMADLVRLARKSEQMVFYHQAGGEEHRLFVPDGSLTYEYRISREGQE